MKKLFSLLLALVMVCCLSSLTVYAATAKAVDAELYRQKYADDFNAALQQSGAYTAQELETAMPIYTVGVWVAHAWDYDAIYEEVLLNRQRTAGIIEKDGKVIYLRASKTGGVWKLYTDAEEPYDFAALIDTYGSAFLYLQDGLIVFPDEPQTIYTIGQSAGESVSLTPYQYTLSQYAKTKCRLGQHKPMHDEDGDIVLSVNDYSVAYAEEYWDYIENKTLRDTQFGIAFFAVVGVVAAGLITLAVVLNKRRKRNPSD